MSVIAFVFDQDLQLPIDGAGVTVTDDNGASFTVSSVAFGDDDKRLVYTGSWSPDEPADGTDIVNVAYNSSLGNIINLIGLAVPSFNITARYNDISITSALSMQGFVSFGINNTLMGPLNRSVPELNNTRFSL